jgi:hypothetical protein
MGFPPLVVVRDDSLQITGVDRDRPSQLLGVDHGAWNSDEYGVTVTEAGRRWGLESNWVGLPGVAADQPVNVLAVDEVGRAAAWAKSYGGAPGTGFVFVRIGYDAAYLDELRRVVEYGILSAAAIPPESMDTATVRAADYPETPAGHRLRWAIAAARSERPGGLDTVFAPGFLEAIPPERLYEFFGSFAPETGGLERVRVEESADTSVVAVARARADGRWWRVWVHVEGAEPHRIGRLVYRLAEDLNAPELSDWSGLDSLLAEFPASATLAVYGVAESGELSPLHRRDADRPRAGRVVHGATIGRAGTESALAEDPRVLPAQGRRIGVAAGTVRRGGCGGAAAPADGQHPAAPAASGRRAGV